MTLPASAQANLNSAPFRIAQQRPTRPVPHIAKTFDSLFDLAEITAELRRRGWNELADFIRHTACQATAYWLDGFATREETEAIFAGLLAQAEHGLLGDELRLAKLLAGSREHLRMTMERWATEDWDAETRTCDLCHNAAAIDIAKSDLDESLVCRQCRYGDAIFPPDTVFTPLAVAGRYDKRSAHDLDGGCFCPSCQDELTSPSAEDGLCPACHESGEVAAITARMPSGTWPAPPDEAAVVERVAAHVLGRIGKCPNCDGTSIDRSFKPPRCLSCDPVDTDMSQVGTLVAECDPSSDPHDGWGGDGAMRRTEQAERLFYRLRNQANEMRETYRGARTGVGRDMFYRRWKRLDHAKERAYRRMYRRRLITGLVYGEQG